MTLQNCGLVFSGAIRVLAHSVLVPVCVFACLKVLHTLLMKCVSALNKTRSLCLTYIQHHTLLLSNTELVGGGGTKKKPFSNKGHFPKHLAPVRFFS